MKKIIFIALTAISLFVVSCTETTHPTPKDIIVSATCDTTIPIDVAKTAPRWNCNGKKLHQEKLIGFEKKYLPLEFTKKVVLPADSLQKMGWYYFDANTAPTRNKFEWFPSWMQDILKWLLYGLIFLAAFVLAAKLFRWLFGLLPTGSIESKKHTPATEHAKSPTSETDLSLRNKNVITFPNGNNNTYVFIGGDFSGGTMVVNGIEIKPKEKDAETTTEHKKEN